MRLEGNRVEKKRLLFLRKEKKKGKGERVTRSVLRPPERGRHESSTGKKEKRGGGEGALSKYRKGGKRKSE